MSTRHLNFKFDFHSITISHFSVGDRKFLLESIETVQLPKHLDIYLSKTEEITELIDLLQDKLNIVDQIPQSM